MCISVEYWLCDQVIFGQIIKGLARFCWEGVLAGLNFVSKIKRQTGPSKTPFINGLIKGVAYHAIVILATGTTFVNATITSFAKPFFGGGFIFGYTQTKTIHNTDVKLGFAMTLLGSFAVPF